MLKAHKKVRPARKPNLSLEYVEDMTNAAKLISNINHSLNLSSSSNEESKQSRTINKSVPRPPIPNSRASKYSLGSVYHQAARLAPVVSCSTNISSSVSGSVEIIISEIDNPQDINSFNTANLSTLKEICEDQSEDTEEKVITNIINQHKSLNYSRNSNDQEVLGKSMQDVKHKQYHEDKQRETKNMQIRQQLLKEFNM